jgi:hypothetical protein
VLISQANILGTSISPDVTAFNASIAVDWHGDVIINFNASGPSLVPGDYFVVHQAGTPEGTFTSPMLYQASLTSYTDPRNDAVIPSP